MSEPSVLDSRIKVVNGSNSNVVKEPFVAFEPEGNNETSKKRGRPVGKKKDDALKTRNRHRKLLSVTVDSNQEACNIIKDKDNRCKLVIKRPGNPEFEEKAQNVIYCFVVQRGIFEGSFICLLSSTLKLHCREEFNKVSSLPFHVVEGFQDLALESALVPGDHIVALEPSKKKTKTTKLDILDESLLDKTPRPERQRYVEQMKAAPSVPGGRELTTTELRERLDNWLERFDTTIAADHSYLLKENRIKFWEPFLSEQPTIVPNKSVTDKSAHDALVRMFNKNNSLPQFKEYAKLLKLPQNKKTSPFIKVGITSIAFWKHIFEEELQDMFRFVSNKTHKGALKSLLRDMDETSSEQEIETEATQVATLNQFKSHLLMYLNFMTWWLCIPIKKRLIEYFSLSHVDAWITALGHKHQLGYANPNTARFKVGFLYSIAKYIRHNSMTINFYTETNIRKLDTKINDAHKKYTYMRDMVLLQNHSVSHLVEIGQYIGFQRWISIFDYCLRICVNWVSLFKDKTLSEEKLKAIIIKNGFQFSDAIAFLLFYLTNFNRGEVYAKAMLDWLKCYEVTPLETDKTTFTQFYFVFNGEEKVMRSCEEHIWQLGSQLNAIFGVYIVKFHPVFRVQNVDSNLFFTVKKRSPVTSTGEISNITERVTLGFTGVSLGNRKCRLHYNGHLVNGLNLSESQIRLLNVGMNHSQAVADKFYTFTNYIALYNNDLPDIAKKTLQALHVKSNDIVMDEIVNAIGEEKEIADKFFKLFPKARIAIEESDKKRRTILTLQQSSTIVERMISEEQHGDADNVDSMEDLVDENDVYQVEEFLDMRLRNGKEEFLVKWSGYDLSENTWEPEENCNPDDIEKFKDRFRNKKL